MKTTYWDLEEKERANLTEQEVEKYGDFELMQAGVLKVKPLVLANVPKMPEPDLEVHVLMIDAYTSVDIASAGPDMLGDIINGAWRIERAYVGGQHVDVARDIDSEKAHVTIKRVYSAEKFAEARASIEKASAAKSANERAESEYSNAQKAQRDALNGLWSDWHECQAKHARLAQVINTWHEYVATAGSEELAAKFLAKAFERSDIVEAAEWWSIAIPLPDVDTEPVAKRTAAAGSLTSAELDF